MSNQKLYGVTLEGGSGNMPVLRAIFSDEKEATSFARLLALKSDPMDRTVRVRVMSVPWELTCKLSSFILKD